jgi:DHA1 family tetracycline resistance protein-like MFS transporter
MPENPALDNASPDPQNSAPKGALFIIFLIVFIDLLGFGVIIPALPFYARAFQASAFEMGLVFSLFSACQFIASPILGAMSDRFGRRPVLILSQLGSTAGYILLATVPMAAGWGWGAHTGLLLLYVSRIIDGISGGNISTAQAYVADVTSREKRAKGMALLGVAFGIGFTIGPAIGGIFGEKHLAWPAIIAATLSTLAAVMTYIRLPETRVRTEVESEVWLHPSKFAPVLKMPAISQLLAISFLCMSAFVMMEAFFGFFVSEQHTFRWGERQTGFFFAFLGLIIIIVQGGMVHRMVKKYGEWPLAIGGPLMISVGMMCFVEAGYRPTLALLMIGGFFNAAGRSFWQPSTSALLSKFTSPDNQGVVFGLYWGLGSLARVLGPMLGSVVYPHLANTGQFLTAAGLLTAAALWTISLRAKHPAEGTAPSRQGPEATLQDV